jgi:hypothetical protein
VKRALAVLVPLASLAAIMVFWVGSASAISEPPYGDDGESTTPSSSIYDFSRSGGTNLTECPQAGLSADNPKPLDHRAMDATEQKSNGGNDVRVNQDYSCLPQDETSLDVNPTATRNIVAGANDYRLGWGTSGFYASSDSGRTWYDGITPFPSLPSGDNLDGGGDPAVVFDSDGVAYYAQINFNRTDDTSGVWVNRSTNGGFTWTRPCVAIQRSQSDTQGACGGAGDVRQPGDGTVSFQQDNDNALDGSVPSHDKEWITAGPRPAGVQPTCFSPFAVPLTQLSTNTVTSPKTTVPCNPDTIGSDRLYVTFSVFQTVGSGTGNAQIFLSYSDDQGRSWSQPKPIYGSGQFCLTGDSSCRDSQGSEPTVNPTTGELWVGFLNGDTEDEDQYLVVHSTDGGQTFSPPSRVDTIYDVNEPRGVNGRTDCTARGQGSTRVVLTNTCFRADTIMHSIVADKRGGDFANDVYVVTFDNRNGTIRDSNNDIFFYKSTDGGNTWIGPTRVNNDPSEAPTATNANGDAAFVRQGARDCGRRNGFISGNPAGCLEHNFGADQFFPWVTIDLKGNLNVSFFDRRNDTDSPVGAGAWPTSKTEVGNYLVWYWGASCQITKTATVSLADPLTQSSTNVPAGASQCVAPEAVVSPTGVTGFNPPPGAVPGQNQNPATLPFRNFQVSDVGSNFDYSFRAGIFAGDYSGNTSGPLVAGPDTPVGDNGFSAGAFWTDARNGRGSGAPTSVEPGRNPICEQSDVFFDTYNINSSSTSSTGTKATGHADPDFLVSPCPAGIQDKGAGNNH